VNKSGHLYIACIQPIIKVTLLLFSGRDFHCQGCGVSFLQESTLKVHVKSYCSGKRYKYGCSLCGAKFPDKKMWKVTWYLESSKSQQTNLNAETTTCKI